MPRRKLSKSWKPDFTLKEEIMVSSCEETSRNIGPAETLRAASVTVSNETTLSKHAWIYLRAQFHLYNCFSGVPLPFHDSCRRQRLLPDISWLSAAAANGSTEHYKLLRAWA